MDDVESLVQVRQKVQMQWHELSYTAPTSKGPKQLIDGVGGHATPGKLLAVMGSSGAGKTTLLNCLSGRSLTGALRGSLQVNGTELTAGGRKAFRKIAAFVTQEVTGHVPQL